jgi:D-alanyl-D-alanine carboxypeptidase
MKNVRKLLTDQVDTNQSPSIQYSFFDLKHTVYEMHYGLKNIHSREKANASTTYHLYSITKTFTALAILQLAQQGKISLDQPVASYLVDFPYAGTITIRHLLSHTSGIPNPMPLSWIHLQEEHQQFDRDLFFKKIFTAHPTLSFPPGTRCKYSNLGYVLLGQVIESISGLPYETYILNNIITPCGTGELGFSLHTTTHATGYHKNWSISNLVLGFLFDKKKYMNKPEGHWQSFKPFYNNGISYGGLFGNRSGLISYAQTLLRPDSILLNDDYKKILFAETVTANKPSGMSLSWFTGTLKGQRFLAHAGGGGGYYTELRLYPDLGTGSVIMYNRSGMTDARMPDKTDHYFIP